MTVVSSVKEDIEHLKEQIAQTQTQITSNKATDPRLLEIRAELTKVNREKRTLEKEILELTRERDSLKRGGLRKRRESISKGERRKSSVFNVPLRERVTDIDVVVVRRRTSRIN